MKGSVFVDPAGLSPSRVTFSAVGQICSASRSRIVSAGSAVAWR
jgi:hypothetical protein